MGKRIVICFDGTWNTPDSDGDIGGDVDTNVRKFWSSVSASDAQGKVQTKWYDEGVGTKWYNKVRGGAFGVGLSDNIQQGYRQLVNSYEDGDEVFIVGFSRGAYTARSLVGLIRNSGLLYPQNVKLVETAYSLYRTRDEHADTQNAEFFRNNYGRMIKIKFLGVWDTVGALGVPLESFEWFNKQYYEFHDTELSSIVENAFHAVAIDEFRETFVPTLWNPKVQPTQRLEQVWFAGAHSDVGGGYTEHDLSNITLAWMQDKATQCGLAFDPALVPKISDANYIAPVHDSFSEFAGGVYKVFNKRVFRVIGATEFGSESVHSSVLRRLEVNDNYKPRNRVATHIDGVRNSGTGRL